MKKLEKYLFILLFLFNLGLLRGEAFAQSAKKAPEDATTRPYLTIEDPKIKPLNDLHKRLIIRSAIKIVMKSQQYQLIFSSPRSFEDAKFEFHKLELKGKKKKFGKNKTGYKLTYSIFDARTKKIVREVELSFVEKRHLVYKSKLLLYELFYGKEKSREFENQLKEETKLELQKAEVDAGIYGTPESLLADNVSNNPANDKKNNSKKKKDGKSGKSPKITASKAKKKNKPKIAEFEAPDLDLKKEAVNTKVDPPQSFKIYSEYSFGVGYSELLVSSKSVIDVSNDLRMVGVQIEAAIQLEENSWNRVHIGFEMNKITSDNTFGISAPRHFNILYDFGSRNSFVRFQGGMEFETQSFANLGTAGEGVKAWDGTFLWFKAGILFEVLLFDHKVGVGGFFYSPFFGSSNFNTDGTEITLTGSKYSFYAMGQIYGNWYLKGRYFREDITSQGLSSLENQHSALTISAVFK
jgi:hypothetical protein